MAQPVSQSQYKNIGTVGTVVLTDRPTALMNIVFPGTYVGTVNFFDSPTAAGTTAANQILSMGLPNTNVGGNIFIGASCKTGLTYAATGTPIMTVMWD